MIGLLLRVAVGGTSSVILGFCALFGLYKCCSCRLRDCRCIKRFLRFFGVDGFEDFELLIVVHDAQYTASTPKLKTLVRMTADRHQVETDPSSKGIYQQPLSLFVEQGTDVIRIELMDTYSTVLANLKLKVELDILGGGGVVRNKAFAMKQKEKGFLNPRIKLSIHKDLSSEEEGLLGNIQTASVETNLVLQEQMQKVGHQSTVTDKVTGEVSSRPLTELELLARGCAGPLEMFGSWGSREDVYLAVRGPPDQKKYIVGIWESQLQSERGAKPTEEIEVLKVQGVQPDPGRGEVFLLNYVQADRSKSRATFRRVDRSRDVWVEMFQLLITKVREEKEAKKKSLGKAPSMR